MMNEKTKILLVNDHQENISTLSALIAADDVEIYSFLNVDEALASITIHNYGLAILDVQINFSGFELSKRIRGIQGYAHLPIIFITAQQNNDQMVLQGYETG